MALDIAGLRPEDEGVYSARATNDLGEAVTTASVRIRCKSATHAAQHTGPLVGHCTVSQQRLVVRRVGGPNYEREGQILKEFRGTLTYLTYRTQL